MKPIVLGLSLLLAGAIGSVSAFAQGCQVSQVTPGGTYKVIIEGREFTAISDEQRIRFLKADVELRAAKQKLEATEKLLSLYEEAKERYDKVLEDQRAYISKLEETKDDYKELAEDYKKLSGEPLFTVEAGIGAAGDDTDPAGLVGIGIRRARVWGYFQENNAGVLIGASLPLF